MVGINITADPRHDVAMICIQSSCGVYSQLLSRIELEGLLDEAQNALSILGDE